MSRLKIGFFIVLGVYLITAGCSAKTADELYLQGVSELQKGNPGGAVVFLKNALEKDKNHRDARYQLAKAYAAAGRYEQAEKEFEKVLRQDPSRKEVPLELAKIHASGKKPDVAVAEIEAFFKQHQRTPEALEILGKALLAAQRPVDAEKSLLEALAAEPDRLSAKLELARVYLHQKRAGDMRAILKEVFAADAANYRGYYLLAEIEASEGNIDGAIAAYHKILEVRPADPVPLYKVGLLHLHKRNDDKASAIADELLQKYPNRGDGYRLRGIISYERKKYREAIDDLQRSVKMSPTVEGYYFLGLSLYNRGEYENALSHFRVILDRNPSFLRARLMTAMILLAQKRIDDSVVEIRKVLQADQQNPLAHNLMGSAWLAKGEYDEGLRELELATRLDPTIVDAHIKKGLFHLSAGRSSEAESDLLTAVKVRPDLLSSRLILFSHYLRQGDRDKATAVLRKGLSGKPDDAVLYNSLASVSFSENRSAEALKLLQKAKEVNPSFLAPHFNLAAYRVSTGDYESALQEYHAVLQRHPQHLQALCKVAALMELTGRSGEALSWYAKAKSTGDPLAFIAMAEWHFRKKEGAKAISVLEEGTRMHPRNPELLALKGKLHQAAGNYQEAMKVFDDLAAVAPDRGTPLKIEAYLARGDTARALELARRVVETKPASAKGYLLLAAIHEKQNDRERAIAELKTAAAKQDGASQALLMLGRLYTLRKEYARAATVLAEAVRKDPFSAPGFFQQGVLLEATGKPAEAVRKYRQALAVSDGFVPALNNLAILCGDGYGKPQEGLKLAVRAAMYSSGSGEVLDTLGYLLLKNGRREEARRVLERALEILPANPTVKYHLALAYRDSGNRTQAVKKLTEALHHGEFAEGKKAKALLSELN